MLTETFGSLKCRIVGQPEQAALTVFLCHGYGAPGTDLVPIAEELLSMFPDGEPEICFVFPEAPHSLAEEGMPDGRAWWSINMMRLQQLLQTNQIEELIQAEPPGMSEARAMLLETLRVYRERYQVPLERCVLGGFSQGAMLATDVTLRLETNPAGLLIYSGMLLCLEQWQQLAPQRVGLPVLQSHGTHDPILPFAASQLLRELLTTSGLEVEFISFPGPHTIPWQMLELTAARLAEWAKKQ